MRKSKKILGYFDYACNSGFAEVSQNLVRNLDSFFKRHNIRLDIAAINYHGDDYNETDNIRVINPRRYAKDLSDVYYRDGVLMMLKEGDYDLLWCINDIDVVAEFFEVADYVRRMRVQHQKKSFDIMLYTPIDSPPKQKMVQKAMRYVDSMITYTEYGYDEIRKATNGMVNPVIPKIISHGCKFSASSYANTGVPQSVIGNIKYKLGIPKGRFVFGTVNRNSARKNISGTMLAYKMFCDEVGEMDKHCLYIHADPKDPMGINLENVANSLGLEVGTNVILAKDYDHLKNSLDDLQLFALNHAFDCFISTTTAEGWGLTIMEAMACGTPAIFPLHTCLPSIMDLLDVEYYPFAIHESELMPIIPLNDADVIRYYVHPEAVMEKMEVVYSNIKRGNSAKEYLPVKSVQRAILEKLNWKQIASDWEPILWAALK